MAAFSLLALFLLGAAAAQPIPLIPAEPMTWEPLWPKGAPGQAGTGDEDIPALSVYVPPASKASGGAVVVCPGGGYAKLALDHEGLQIARWLNTHGVAAFVLRYRLGPKYHHPIQQGDVLRAVRTVRARAAAYHVDPKRIGVWGFSAGGHLASTAATLFDAGNAKAADPIDRVSARPDFAVLAYPVIAMDGPFAHTGSRARLLGDAPAAELTAALSTDRRVTAQTPPTFLFHTSEDSGVPPENSVSFYQALRRAGVPAELHIYQRGRHGVGLAPQDPVLSSWGDRLLDWLRGLGVAKPLQP